MVPYTLALCVPKSLPSVPTTTTHTALPIIYCQADRTPPPRGLLAICTTPPQVQLPPAPLTSRNARNMGCPYHQLDNGAQGAAGNLPAFSTITTTMGRRTSQHAGSSRPQESAPRHGGRKSEPLAPSLSPQVQPGPLLEQGKTELGPSSPPALVRFTHLPTVHSVCTPPAGTTPALPYPPFTHRTQSAKAPATLSLSRTRKLPSRPARASNSSAAARLKSRWYQAGTGLPSAPPEPGAPHAEAMAPRQGSAPPGAPHPTAPGR